MSAAKLAIATRRIEEAIAHQDLDTIANLYTPDAVLLSSNGEIINGREAIRQKLKTSMANGLRSSTFKAIKIEVSGDIATDIGHGSSRLHTPAGAKVYEMTYMVVWKRIDGQWLIHRDMVTARPPA
jgi:uncharacterized protein (TIGR02246 family)